MKVLKTANFYCEICTKRLHKKATYASVARNLLKHLHSMLQIGKIQHVMCVNYYPIGWLSIRYLLQQIPENMEEKMEKEKKATKAAETKKKAAAITEEVKKEVKKAVKETKKTAEKAVAAVEKTAAKTRAKKKVVTEEVILEYRGMQVNVEALLADAKADWIANGHKEKDYVSCKLYLKPEDRRAYYVINDIDEGNVPC